MKLHIENIGKIKSADVVLDGITVIAGKNNTGKSTVGKTLYCIFNSLYNIDEKIKRDKNIYIGRVILSSLDINIPSLFLITYHEDLLEDIINKIKHNHSDDVGKLLCNITSLYRDKPEDMSDYDDVIDSEIVENVINRVNEALSISDQVFYTHIANNIFNSEFSNQIVNFNAETGEAVLSIKNKDIILNIDKKSVSSDNLMKLNEDIIYIESPFILDNIDTFHYDEILPHRNNIISKLYSGNDNKTITSEIIIQNKLENIFNLLSDIGIGELFKESSDTRKNTFKYKEENSDNKIEISNISAGIKTFLILKTLILNSHIAEKGCIILDEPEVHLHPEWQLVFAKLIVLLQKSFNLHILLNTHSPYFLRAIQVYSSKYEIADRCNYYLAENNEDGTASIRDVKGSIEEIYKLLHRPFQDLENE